MQTCSNKTCDVRHIYHEVCADFLSYLGNSLEINDPWVCRSTCNDKLRLVLLSQLFEVVIIDETVICKTVWNELIVLSAHVDR